MGNEKTIITTLEGLLKEEEEAYSAHPSSMFNYFYKPISSLAAEDGKYISGFKHATTITIQASLLKQHVYGEAFVNCLWDAALEVVSDKDERFIHRFEQMFSSCAIIDLGVMAGWKEGPKQHGIAFFQPLLDHFKGSRAEYDRSLGWALLAHGETDQAADYILGDFSKTPVAGATFGPNVQGMQVQIARAIVNGSDGKDIEAAWRSYLDEFPSLIACEMGDYYDLLWAARAVHVVINGQEESTTLGWLHEQIGANEISLT